MYIFGVCERYKNKNIRVIKINFYNNFFKSEFTYKKICHINKILISVIIFLTKGS